MAIHPVVPTCAHCACRIIGHGVEAGGKFYCCASCAKMSGMEGARDRIEAGARMQSRLRLPPLFDNL
ncbi:MAG: hypothetical protein ACE148_14025 [Vicinamibacterales bacterium]